MYIHIEKTIFAGVKHVNDSCNGCGAFQIAGLKWRCISCKYYNLCTACYMTNYHNLDHKFRRFQNIESKG